MRRVKEYGFNGLAGCVTQFKSRDTGTLVGVYHSMQSGMESDPELPWTTVCEAHNTLVCHPSLKAALRTRSPREFCDDCRDLFEATKPTDRQLRLIERLLKEYAIEAPDGFADALSRNQAGIFIEMVTRRHLKPAGFEGKKVSGWKPMAMQWNERGEFQGWK